MAYSSVRCRKNRPEKAIIIAALLALPVIPLWAFSSGSLMLGLGAFLMQFMVQGAWGVVPTYLTELVPANTRAVLPGFVYQLGNLIASVNATLQASIAEHHGHNYGLAMAIVAGTVAVAIALLVFFGKDTRGKAITGAVKIRACAPTYEIRAIRMRYDQIAPNNNAKSVVMSRAAVVPL